MLTEKETESNSPLEKFTANELNLHYTSVATLCSTIELARILDTPLNLNETVFDVDDFTYVQVLQAALLER